MGAKYYLALWFRLGGGPAIDVNHIARLPGENNRIEAKKAAGGLPHSLRGRPTPPFANTTGPVLLLGGGGPGQDLHTTGVPTAGGYAAYSGPRCRTPPRSAPTFWPSRCGLSTPVEGKQILVTPPSGRLVPAAGVHSKIAPSLGPTCRREGPLAPPRRSGAMLRDREDAPADLAVLRAALRRLWPRPTPAVAPGPSWPCASPTTPWNYLPDPSSSPPQGILGRGRTGRTTLPRRGPFSWGKRKPLVGGVPLVPRLTYQEADTGFSHPPLRPGPPENLFSF